MQPFGPTGGAPCERPDLLPLFAGTPVTNVLYDERIDGRWRALAVVAPLDGKPWRRRAIEIKGGDFDAAVRYLREWASGGKEAANIIEGRSLNDEPHIVATQVLDYGQRLSIRLSDGRVLRYTVDQLLDAAPSKQETVSA